MMTASSGGVEWSHMIKPLLAASYGSHCKSDAIDLIRSINKSKEEILHHDDNCQNFYAAFAPLAADFLASNSRDISPGVLTQAIAASKVLLQYMVSRVGEPPLQVTLSPQNLGSSDDKQSDAESPQKSSQGSESGDKEKTFTIQDKHYLFAIHALCRGSRTLQMADKANLVAAMKGAKLPSHIRISSSAERESYAKENRRSRSDPSASILEQFLSPVHDVKNVHVPFTSISEKEDTEILADTPTWPTENNLLAARCISALQVMGGGDIFLDICLQLPTIQKFTQRYKELLEGKGHGFPTNYAESLALKSGISQMLQDLTTVWRIMCLPILEPLTVSRLQKLITIVMVGLFISLSVAASVGVISIASQATSSTKTPPLSKDEDLDVLAPQITEKALDLFNVVLTTVQMSTRTGGHNVQNVQLMGAWLLLSGLNHITTILSNVSSSGDKKDDKGRSPIRKEGSGSGRLNLSKVQQGFSVVCVALASQGLSLLTGLLDDVKVEEYSSTKPPEAARLDPLEQYTATERLARIFNAVPLNQLLYYIAIVSYRKSCSFKRSSKSYSEGDTFSISDSTSYYEYEFSEESLGEEDDDSVIIGSWFEEPAVSGEDPEKTAATTSEESSAGPNQQSKPGKSGVNETTLVPEKGQPHGFISLASHAFLLMNNSMVDSECVYVQQYVKSGLGEMHMVILAAIIRDLDKETARLDSGTTSSSCGTTLNSLYDEFSLSLYRYTHNIIASSYLNESLQNTLLTQLGVSPWAIDVDWPLQVLPRTLSVLAQVLLSRQRKDSDQLRCDSDAACVLIWQRLIKTLTRSIMCFNPQEGEVDDLNVEHAQLLLFLFHSLQLMQKKNVLLNVAKALVTINPVFSRAMKDVQILHLSRILILFDYLMKNLYEAPQVLIDQIQWNLFKKIASPQTPGTTTSKDTPEDKKLYHSFYTLDTEYRRRAPAEDNVRSPCFYMLTPCDSNTQETPKLDGLACSFILATPDILNYSTFYDTILGLLNIGRQLDLTLRSGNEPLSCLGLCAIEYTYALAFKTFLIMPPSVASLEALANPETAFEGPQVIHPIVWGPRATSKVFTGWIKDGLVRQSLTTQKADSILKTVSTTTCSLQYQMRLIAQIAQTIMPRVTSNSAMAGKSEMPDFSEVYLLDSVISAVLASIEETCAKADVSLETSESSEVFSALKISPDLVPIGPILSVTSLMMRVARYLVVQRTVNKDDEKDKPKEFYGNLLSMSGDKISFLRGCLKRDILPQKLLSALEFWNTVEGRNLTESPCKRLLKGDTNLPEDTVCTVSMEHFGALSGQTTFSMHVSVKHLIFSLVKFISTVGPWYHDPEKHHSNGVESVITMAMDATTESMTGALQECICNVTHISMDGVTENDLPAKVRSTLYKRNLAHIQKVFLFTFQEDSNVVNRGILEGCGSYMEYLLDGSVAQTALTSFFEEQDSTKMVLRPLSAEINKQEQPFSPKKFPLLGVILKFCVKLLAEIESHPDNDNLKGLYSKYSLGSWIESSILDQWFLECLIENAEKEKEKLDCWSLLKALASLSKLPDLAMIDSQNFVSSLLVLGNRILERGPQKLNVLGQLLRIMHSLLQNATSEQHVSLFKAVSKWIVKCKEFLGGEHDEKVHDVLSQLLPYVSDVVVALKLGSKVSSSSGPSETGSRDGTWRGEGSSSEMNTPLYDLENSEYSNWEIPEDEESVAEDSDDENLCNRLCTYTLTQKDFMNQHWYHCHTCKMIEGVGVCTVCAKVCHKGHDVTYAKFGSFFCDCGAEQEGTCQALVRRAPTSGESSTQVASSNYVADSVVHSFNLKQSSSQSSLATTEKAAEETQKQRQAMSKKLEGSHDVLLSEIISSDIGSIVLDLLNNLIPTIKSLSLEKSSIGSYQRVMDALNLLHDGPKAIKSTDNLMQATLGSQEGAFENVRLNYQGEQGQTIRQLVNTYCIHRIAMCVLSSPGSRRQHLAVSHEKHKITILQLSSLLKQHDSTKKKLTLTRLSAPPIPFLVLSIASNPANDDFLAVCGLKECHILVLSSTGSVDDHHVLHPHLETGNYIIRAVWLPGQQTRLALITAEFVKIYDLSVDFLCPLYFFQMPSGKIKDACFVVTQDDNYHLVIMASSGYLFTHLLCEESSAKHGSFYITNVLQVSHPDLKDCNGEVAGGGVSVYYSHTLQMLCFSYVQGKSFLAPLKNIRESEKLEKLFKVPMRQNASHSSSSSTSGSSGTSTESGTGSSKQAAAPPLCQWSEVQGHPGLITCLAQHVGEGTSKGAVNFPVVIMVKEDSIQVQELKITPAKTRITDLVAIRHSLGPNPDTKTTLILLCEDGSLRIFNANPQTTGFWLSPQMQEASFMASVFPTKKKKLPKPGRAAGALTFPVDFFEHCSLMNDIEFGGNDVLQIYNVAQLKQRLNGQGTYIASSKPGGFQLEATNNDSNLVICGIRVAVGTTHSQRIPSYVEVHGRSIPTVTTRRRFFDIPFTREESLHSDKKIVITFGPSNDSNSVTVVDSVKLYSKTKEDFGWPEEIDDIPGASGSPSGDGGFSGVGSSCHPLTATDMLVSAALEILDGCIAVDGSKFRRTDAVELATKFLNLPLPPSVQLNTRSLLASLHPTKAAYHNHKDSEQLRAVMRGLKELSTAEPKQIDCESFHRYLIMARSVAASRPQNLVKFTSGDVASLKSSDSSSDMDVEKKSKTLEIDVPKNAVPAFLKQLVAIFWDLHKARSPNMSSSPICQPGLTHPEATVVSLIEIIHGYSLANPSCVPYAVNLYTEFLLSTDQTISFSTKQALIKALRPSHTPRKLYSQSPPKETASGADKSDSLNSSNVRNETSSEVAADSDADFEVARSRETYRAQRVRTNASAGGAVAAADNVGDALGEILDAEDDDAMVELAIALSLHEGGEDEVGNDVEFGQIDPEYPGVMRLQLPALGGEMPNALEDGEDDAEHDDVEVVQHLGHDSDTTVSANASDDDEGSTAATEGGSNLTMVSPAEQACSGGSESGGSVVESIGGEHNVSTVSSVFGETSQENPPNASSVPQPGTSEALVSEEQETEAKLRALRSTLLLGLMENISSLKNLPGLRSVPFLQVIHMLASNLNASDKAEREILESLLKVVVDQIDLKSWQECDVNTHSNEQEVQFVILRLLGVMMARTKSSSSRSTCDTNSLAYIAADTLVQSGITEACLSFLKSLLTYWRNEEKNTGAKIIIGGSLLKPRVKGPLPDMAPLFSKTLSKGLAKEVFAKFPDQLTEHLLRIPYQIKKIKEVEFEQDWKQILCEYTMLQQGATVKRQIRKLLLFICGSKEQYRYVRDLYALDHHIESIKSLCSDGGFTYAACSSSNSISLPYDSMIRLVEHLRGCVDIGCARTQNWQSYCLKDEAVMPFMLEISCLLEEGVSQTVLQLLQAAICPNTKSTDSAQQSSGTSGDGDPVGGSVKALVAQINRFLDKSVLVKFIHTFLLESNATSVRWQAHALILSIYRNSNKKDQECLLGIMWSLWPRLPSSGRKAAQFVDLLGYFSLKTPHNESKLREEMEKAINVLQTQSHLLTHHANANLYNSLSSLVEFDGYYLESEPCLVCNNPEVPFSTVKLSYIKADTRYTTKTQVVKLVTSHMISRLNLRIFDLKRTKMVHVLNIYYNNRNQSVVELKNKPAMWNKAKKVTLSNGQTEVKVDFPLPIVACNLMFEYAEFYENLQASTETLQCPRCSAHVPASPGVCGNCGENVYQCHKCRAINYDEKDPFLCNSCGYCKYAKFEYSFLSRACCAVDPIENEDDRQKAVLNIDNLLEKADRAYKQLQSYKPSLEKTLFDLGEHGSDGNDESSSKSSSTQVNRHIHQLAIKYSTDCKANFDELSKIIQKVQASRRELVAFDRQQKEGGKRIVGSPTDTNSASNAGQQLGRCYGCAAATTEHCITLLRALAINPQLRHGLCHLGLIQNLIEYNLRRGSVQVRSEVRDLLCSLTKDDPSATDQLNDLIVTRISLALSQVTSPDLASSVRHEMALLAASAQQEDSCWEQRLRCVMKVFLMAGGCNASPMVMEHITLPCLEILLSVASHNNASKKSGNKITEAFVNALQSSNKIPVFDHALPDLYSGKARIGVNVNEWLAGNPSESFNQWRSRSLHKIKPIRVESLKKNEVRERFLMEKYASKWLVSTISKRSTFILSETAWVKRVLFNPSSRMARKVAANLIYSLCQSNYSRKLQVMNLLTSFLPEIGRSGESSEEFVALFQKFLQSYKWKYYLALKGVLPTLADLIMVEIKHLSLLEDTTLSIDLSQGYALKVLTELLTTFVDVDSIKSTYKSKLLKTVLTGYLSLRKLIVQRTKLIDDTQNKFLELLEDMTCGTEAETQEFMTVCVDTLSQYPPGDLRTPVFIFERLCSIIYPEENDIGEFFITLDKDPLQEDFLQGRMVANPYNSSDSGMGPLMKDIKIKICQDCELVALLEEENSMELLVCNKIISLDLPVKEVYKKVWAVENSDSSSMRIVYRMRGLMGDATEEFVETLNTEEQSTVDDEKVYKMASVMSKCNGLQVMLEYLQRITDLCHAKPLVSVVLKLFDLCTKLRVNRDKLADPSFGAIPVLLQTLKQCLAAEPEMVTGTSGGITFTEQILNSIESILVQASSNESHQYGELVEACCLEDIHLLLNYCGTSSRTNVQVRERLMEVLPFLVYGNKEKIELLIGHFKPVLDFTKFDETASPEDHDKIEAFCVFCAGIEKNHIGQQLQDMPIITSIVKDALGYIEKHIPRTKKFLGTCDDDWKEFISKPSLTYILRILTGLATKHLGTQQLVAKSYIPAIHKLEQISSDEHVGSLAENLLGALTDDPAIVQLVSDTRRETKMEKKDLAMRTRKKELEKLGLIANEKEQITCGSVLLQQMDQLTEENGLVCAICLEGYKCQPQKVLGIYTFTKLWPLPDGEKMKPKHANFTTVSHFNVVHVECHIAAVRVSLSHRVCHPRDEWERAALHNANTKANGLLPMWGPMVPESVFASCLARHNTDMMECIGYRDIDYMSHLGDLRILLTRFSQEKSLSDDCGGGGPQSNMNLMPYVLHTALYILNSTRGPSVETPRVEQFLEDSKSVWVTSSFEWESPSLFAVVALAVLPYNKWKEHRMYFLKRLLTTVHVRKVCTKCPTGGKVHDKSVQPWSVYKEATIFWGLIDNLYSVMFKKVSCDGTWSNNLADYIRHNDQALCEASHKILSTYQDDLIPCESFAEFVDVAGILNEIERPEQFLSDLLQSLP